MGHCYFKKSLKNLEIDVEDDENFLEDLDQLQESEDALLDQEYQTLNLGSFSETNFEMHTIQEKETRPCLIFKNYLK